MDQGQDENLIAKGRIITDKIAVDFHKKGDSSLLFGSGILRMGEEGKIFFGHVVTVNTDHTITTAERILIRRDML